MAAVESPAQAVKITLPHVVVFGKNSFIGRGFVEHAATVSDSVVAFGSAECDLLNAEDVRQALAPFLGQEVHIVLLAVVNKGRENSYESFCKNILMVRNVLAHLGPLDVASMLYLSSVDVYGNRPPIPITEETPLQPDTWYAQSKCVSEWMLRALDHSAFPVSVLRIPGVYDLSTEDNSVVARMARAIRDTGIVRITGDGSSLRDYVHRKDLANLMVALLGLRYDGVLNVATGESLTVAQVARAVSAAVGRPFKPEFVAAEDDRQFDLVFDTAALRDAVPDVELRYICEVLRQYKEQASE